VFIPTGPLFLPNFCFCLALVSNPFSFCNTFRLMSHSKQSHDFSIFSILCIYVYSSRVRKPFVDYRPQWFARLRSIVPNTREWVLRSCISDLEPLNPFAVSSYKKSVLYHLTMTFWKSIDLLSNYQSLSFSQHGSRWVYIRVDIIFLCYSFAFL